MTILTLVLQMLYGDTGSELLRWFRNDYHSVEIIRSYSDDLEMIIIWLKSLTPNLFMHSIHFPRYSVIGLNGKSAERFTWWRGEANYSPGQFDLIDVLFFLTDCLGLVFHCRSLCNLIWEMRQLTCLRLEAGK